MPELPEIENLVREIRSLAVGRTAGKINYLRADIREPIPKAAVTRILCNQEICAVRRRGKYMLIYTKCGAVGIHLGMSGKFIFLDQSSPQEKHTHVVFSLKKIGAKSPSGAFHFIDPRRFGRIFAIEGERAAMMDHPFLAHLGPEPLDEKTDLASHLFDESRNRSVPTKLFVMNHEIVVGVGNIYASESLWRAKISPLRKAHSLTRRECVLWADAIKTVLNAAIEMGGTTIRDYRSSDNTAGKFQEKLAVYGKNGHPCRLCGTGVLHIAQSGRATYYCPLCQN